MPNPPTAYFRSPSLNPTTPLPLVELPFTPLPLVETPLTPTPFVDLPRTPAPGPSPKTPVPMGGVWNGTLLPANPNTPVPVWLFTVPMTPRPPEAASHAPATPAQFEVVYVVRPRMPSGRLIPTG